MAGHVYVIGSRNFGWYKIGKSSNATVRVADLGILLPFRVEVIAVWKSPNHHEFERFLHEMYSEYRINGEWFLFKAGKLQEVLSEIDSMRLAAGKTANSIGYSNIDKDISCGAPRSVDKRIDKLVSRANKAEVRVKELEALLKAMPMPKV